MAQASVTPAEREKRIVVRAGLFVGLGLILAGIVVFVMGKERNLFDQQNVYTGAFENVDGLQLDSPVRLGGLQVGRVVNISFAPDLGDKRIVVTMEIVAKFGERIRADSVARVTGRGVLGDKAIDISFGSPNEAIVPHDGEIQTGTSGDISALLATSSEIVDNVLSISKDLRAGVQEYMKPDLRNDVTALVKSVRNIADEIESGKGTLHALVYDPKTTEDVRLLIARAAKAASSLDSAVAHVDGLLADVRNGHGSLHALIYDDKIARALGDLGTAASEVATLVHDAKVSKNGAVHQLVYGDAGSMLADLGKAASDLKAITSKVQKGEGSLGAVINDPTVYEDLKEILGNVKRNRILRELVRLSISNSDKVEGAGKPK